MLRRETEEESPADYIQESCNRMSKMWFDLGVIEAGRFVSLLTLHLNPIFIPGRRADEMTI